MSCVELLGKGVVGTVLCQGAMQGVKGPSMISVAKSSKYGILCSSDTEIPS